MKQTFDLFATESSSDGDATECLEAACGGETALSPRDGGAPLVNGLPAIGGETGKPRARLAVDGVDRTSEPDATLPPGRAVPQQSH